MIVLPKKINLIDVPYPILNESKTRICVENGLIVTFAMYVLESGPSYTS